MSTTLPLFWNLSSVSKKERLDSSVKLVSALQSQFSYGSENSEGEDEEDAIDPLTKYNAQDVSYSIRRLVRGLASPRESSRLGFSVALTELLSRIQNFTCRQIFSLLMHSTKMQKSMSRQEERDNLFARLFGITAIIQSGLLVRTDPLTQSPSSAPDASTLDAFNEIIDELQSLAEKKSWLRESVAWTLLLALDALQSSSTTWKEQAFEHALETLYNKDAPWGPEKIVLTLKLQESQPSIDWRKYTGPTFSSPELLSTSNLHMLAQILKDAEDQEGGKTGGGTSKVELHFVWNVLIDLLLPTDPSKSPAKGNFADFFRVVVDESLFSATSSPQRKYWGLQIFRQALPRVSDDVLPMLFTKNFMRTWINHLSKPDRYLHKAAKQVASDVAAFVKGRPQLGMGLIIQLTGANGSPQFDKLTRTKTVEGILTSMTLDGITEYADHLISQFNECDGIDDVEAINARRLWVTEQLAALIRHGAIPKDDAWIEGILDWLVVQGLFIIRKPTKQNTYRGTQIVVKPPLSDSLRASCRARLLSLLSDLTNQTTTVKPGPDAKPARAVGVTSSGEFWIRRTLNVIEALHKDAKHLSPLSELDYDDQELWTRVQALDIQLQQPLADAAAKEAAQGCRLLLAGLVVAEYCSEEEGWDTETLQSAVSFVQQLVPKGKPQKSKKADNGKPSEDAPAPVDGLVDIIIGLLEKSSSYLRTLANNTFSLLSATVTETSIDLILAQLERRDPTHNDGSDIDMEEDGEEGSGGEDEDSDQEDSGSDDDDDDIEDSDEDGDIDEELRNKILEALKINGIEPVNEDEEEDETAMDDDQMLALDDQLAAVFKSRMQEQKSGKDVDAQREATHFKNRVLDLVDVFVKKQPTSPLVVTLVLPLITLITSSGSDEKQLIDKAQGILRSRIGKLKEVPDDVPLDKVSEVLEALHTRARKSRSDVSSTICAVCLYLSKIMVHHQAEDKVVALYKITLEDFLTRKNSALSPVFFQEFVNKFTGLAWRLRKPLLELSDKAVNGYRRLQALRLVQSLLNTLHSIDAPEDEVTDFMTTLRKSLYSLVSDSCGEKASLTVAQVKDVLKLALSAIRQTLRLPAAEVDTIWAPKKWSKLADKLSEAPTLKFSPALPNICRQIVQSASKKKGEKGADKVSTGKKRKGDEAIKVDAGESKRQKKKVKT